MSSIIKHLPELVDNNVISPQTAQDIERYYATKKQPQTNTMLMLFGAFGGLLTGLGIILVFAHNWDNFSTAVKTALAIVPLLLFQVFAAYTILKNKSRVWKETAGTLLFCMVGASISLIAQIYNISGDFPVFLRTWVLLCIPLIYLLNSNAVAVLILVFGTWYASEAGYSVSSYSLRVQPPYMYLVFLAALLPYYIGYLRNHANSRMTYLFNWLVPISALIALGTFLENAGAFSIVLYIAFICLLYTIGTLPYFGRQLYRHNGFKVLGELGIIIVLLVSSFRWVWIELIFNSPTVPFIIFWAVLLLINIILIFRYKSSMLALASKWVSLIYPVLYIIAWYDVVLATILANLAVLAYGIMAISNGINRLQFSTLNFGLLVLAVLTTCRFFDTNISFAVRGLLFVTVGSGFFVANYIVVKRKKDLLNTSNHEN